MDQNEIKNNILNNPIEIIDKLFNENKNNLENGSIHKKFEQIISNDETYLSIPQIDTINQCDLSNCKLVKIRCMIQDIFDPQFCPSYYKIKNLQTNQIRYESSKYKDYINLKDDEEVDSNFNSQPFDKLVLYCIPIPCDNNCDNNSNNNGNNGNNSNKIKNIDINKIYNFPIPIEENNNKNNKTPFIVNVYDENILLDDKGEPIPFKINELVEFIGIVSKFNPNNNKNNKDFEPDQPIANLMSTLELEDELSQIPDSLIPQFHSITYRYINPYTNPTITNNPYNNNNYNNNNNNNNNNNLSKNEIEKLREELLTFISKFVIDKNLSEYLLLHILSKVYSFSAGLCIGNFSLNITIPNKENFSHMADIIELLFSKLTSRSHRFQVTIESLNDSSIIPFKDYDRNRLVSGLLQLPKNTHLIIDETKLSEGKIESQGLKALNAFTTLSTLQKVEYDFQYHPIEIQTDILLSTISYGKPLIKGFCEVSIDSSVTLPSLNDLRNLSFDQEKLLSFRNYIYYCKNLNFKLLSDQDENSDATKLIQDDFVKTRQSDQNMTQDIFHCWLTLARLLALSFGDNCITIDKWNKMKMIEEIRKNKNK
ncbi:hypothetical protein DICPUDRAFT_94871 [Dictyostelium purpureum]|uniref:Mini-chromosome maintenance complex-binding protein n=1 Tax=Dictyostelium purpureum TaxID=5786 RepID=F0ZPI7_DICPU|nr:uncharacterized protein DICPUDRAFT_94871 [Dictyostelium purpureum]EGC34130.1 hypothetical protein DICPUDRAFT_94871 [Dictyostelium purpureum]|eukprot:XP_003289328.1 hypothetical protein DICPUDRAFT_94871 [Dictyostelium purpureum]